MTSDTRTSAKIDRDIAEKRAAVAANIKHLKGSVTLGTVAQYVGTSGVRFADGMGKSALKQAQRNPLPVATIAAWIAWLIAANTKTRGEDVKIFETAPDPSLKDEIPPANGPRHPRTPPSALKHHVARYL